MFPVTFWFPVNFDYSTKSTGSTKFKTTTTKTKKKKKKKKLQLELTQFWS